MIIELVSLSPSPPRMGKRTCCVKASTPFSVTFPGSQKAWNEDSQQSSHFISAIFGPTHVHNMFNFTYCIIYVRVIYMYSGNSAPRTPPKSSHLRYCGHFVWSRIHLHSFVYNLNSWNVYSVKWTGFSDPLALGLYKNSLYKTDCNSPMQNCPSLMIGSTTGHYNTTGTHST